MKIKEIFEGRVSDRLVLDKEWDRQNGAQPAATPAQKELNYHLTVNGKKWGDFATEKLALAAANSLYAKNPRLRINVVPH